MTSLIQSAKVTHLLEVANEVRFIKLGEGGIWEQSCIEQEGTIRLGYQSNQHRECLAGDWDAVRTHWLAVRNGREGAATSDERQIRDFYTQPASTLWITFYRRQLHWCFAEEEVTELGDDLSRIRKVIGQWSSKSANGTTLHVGNLDGRVSKVQAYRGTICAVERDDYLIRKIRGERQPEVIAARKAFEALCWQAQTLIAGLWWHDFELLTDLIFSRAGWQRISVLGKTEKDVDIDMLSPVTGKRAYIQVKSSADFPTLENSLKLFHDSAIYSEMYFVVHNVQNDSRVLAYQEPGVSVIGPEKLSELTINSGLMDWLIKKHE